MSDSEASERGGFSAAGSALGYLVQVDYGLLLMLDRMTSVEDLELSLETIDDIVFHEGETATDVFQSKHHVNGRGSLGDRSVDLWKTIHNWVAEPTEAHTSLTLMSTSSAPAGSAAALLRPGAERHVANALTALDTVTRTDPAQSIKDYCAPFAAMEPSARMALVDRIVVLDGTLPAAEIGAALALAVRTNARPEHRAAFVNRLRGWWHGRVLLHLTEVAEGRRDRVSAIEVEEQLLAIANALRDGNLPIDFENLPQPDAEVVEDDMRTFVLQLRLIAMGNARIRQCIYDHHRAYMQRSQWQRERLLNVGELAAYDARLVDEWRRHFTPLTDPGPGQTNEQIQAEARQRFHRLDTSPLPAIRPLVAAGFVANGSLHLLADEPRIGWHPEWVAHLKVTLPPVTDARSDAA